MANRQFRYVLNHDNSLVRGNSREQNFGDRRFATSRRTRHEDGPVIERLPHPGVVHTKVGLTHHQLSRETQGKQCRIASDGRQDHVRADVPGESGVADGFGVIDSATGQFNEAHSDAARFPRFKPNPRILKPHRSTDPYHTATVDTDIAYGGLDDPTERTERSVKSGGHSVIVTIRESV